MNASFKAAPRDLTTEGLARVSAEPISSRSWTRLIPQSEQQTDLHFEARPDVARMVVDGVRGLDQSPALAELLAAIVADPTLEEGLFRGTDGRLIEAHMRPYFTYTWIVVPFLTAYFTRTATHITATGTVPPFDPSVFENIFGRLASDLADPTKSRVVRFTPLANVRIEGEVVEVHLTYGYEWSHRT